MTFKKILLGSVFPILCIIIYGALATSLNKFYVPPIELIVNELIQYAITGELLMDVIDSIIRFAVGLLISVMIAIPLGITISLSDLCKSVVMPTFNAIRVLPITALLPIIIIAFGFSTTSALVVIFLAAFFPTLIATVNATVPVIDNYKYLKVEYNLSTTYMLYNVYYKGALSEILTGLDLSVNAAFRIMIISELFGSTTGLGYRLVDAAQYLDFKKTYAVILVISILGVAVSWVMGTVKRRLLSWQ